MKKIAFTPKTSQPLMVCLHMLWTLSLGGFISNSQAGSMPSALSNGSHPEDHRHAPLTDLNGYFPFQVPETIAEWEDRAEQLRTHLLVVNGLWPMPTKTALNTVIHGKVDQGDYTIEKVFFESFPGFYVTGSLYRPKGFAGPRPAILCPHGHWNNGRFTENESIWTEINSGAERFETGGRSPLQSRCVQLARMGCVVFHYDMIGYADSIQISYDLAHRFAKQRPEMNGSDRWGFFSPQAESHLQSIMGLQTWNSIRSLDFLETLPDVDRSRLGITGASGGGTQTFLLAAIDDRLAVSFPAVMVSTAMQGGCTCENTCGLRIPAGNVEFAALFAPKPLGMTGANDWTVEMSSKGFPELQKLYSMYGAKDNVQLAQLNHFGHNYNYVSRASMYQFMNKHLNLDLGGPIIEQDYEFLRADDLSVWTNGYEAPKGGPEFEQELLQYWRRDAEEKLAPSAQSIHAFQNLHAPAIEAIIGRTIESVGKTELELNHKSQKDGYLEMAGVVKNLTHGEAVPTLYLHPDDWNGRTIIWPTINGKNGLLDSNGKPNSEARALLNEGCTVVGVDLLFQGESRGNESPVNQNQVVDNPREFAGYTYGYNHPLFVKRVHDLLTSIENIRTNEKRASSTIELKGSGSAAYLAAAARAVSRDTIQNAILDLDGLSNEPISDYRDPDFFFGSAKLASISACLAVGAPSRLQVRNGDQELKNLLAGIYASAGFPHRLVTE
jgi:dienelactone hydrolase